MKKTKLLALVILLLISFNVIAQENVKDTTKKSSLIQRNPKKPGGIFIAPVLGAEFPTGEFASNSKYSFCFGGRLEYSSLYIYPFVIGATIQYQNHDGSDDFKTLHLINNMSTKILSFGGSVDMLLNKYLKSSYTIPFIFAEVKMLNINREVSPPENFPNLKATDNVIAIGGGAGFTLYIFDIYFTWLSAKEYNTFSVRTRFRIPLIKF